ncbi:MAG: tRNA (adenine-N1)-methyltransferase [Anaerolineae bacterium]
MRLAAEGDRVLLLSRRGKQFIITLHRGERLHTHRGMVEHDALIGQPYGSAISTHTGEPLYVMRPSIHDELMAIRRASQVIYPKELGEILLRLDARPGARVIEAGTGSGAMTMALANAVQPNGRVFSYDQRADMLALAAQNLERVGLQDMVEFVERDIAEGFVHGDVDALFLDVRDPCAFLGPAASALAGGGHLGILVPTTNQIVALLEELEGSVFVDVDVMEILQRHYKPVPGRLRPEDTMIGHTGYLLFARKIRPVARSERATSGATSSATVADSIGGESDPA